MTNTSFFLIILADVFFSIASSASVMVNQAGYLPKAQKIFVSTSAADSFRIVELSTGIVRFTGTLSVSRLNDPASGMNVYKGDFSSLTHPGTYRVSLLTSGTAEDSYPFTIDDDVYGPVFQKALKGFYYQRCGQTLPALFAGVYARMPACHTNDGFFHATAESAGFKAATGGWHDAGDYGKYIIDAGVTVGTLLMAYELFPSRFSSDVIGILESGNSVPDILDESRYEIEWMLKMQHPNGGVFCKLTRAQFEGFVMPSADNSATRYLYQISTAATGDFAAVCARASRTYRAFDPVFADTCLAAARRAWSYLQSHSSIVPAGGFKNPAGTGTGEYGDANDSDERLWAAAELFSATGESPFASYYTLRYGTGPLLSQTMSWQNVRTMANLTYFYTQQASANALTKSLLRESLLQYATVLVGQASSEGFQVAIKPGEYSWGSNSEVLNRALMLILASRENGNPSMLNAAQAQLDYILGKNAHNISFVTGVGAHHVMNPHHRPSASDNVTEPVPGLMAGGPEQNRSDDALKAKFTSTTPPALVYLDNVESYASNEICINWNAPLVFAAGYFASEGASVSGTGQMRGGSVSADFRLEQNRPNPFNPSTEISFSVSENSLITLEVFDTVGRRVASLLDQVMMSPGTRTVVLDGTHLSSGVYLYRFTAKHGMNVFTETKRAIFMK